MTKNYSVSIASNQEDNISLSSKLVKYFQSTGCSVQDCKEIFTSAFKIKENINDSIAYVIAHINKRDFEMFCVEGTYIFLSKPVEEDTALASKCIEEFNITENLNNVNDLYFDEDSSHSEYVKNLL